MPPPLPPLHPGTPTPTTNWWKIGCLGCLSLIVLALVAGGALFVGVLYSVRSSEAYQVALTATTQSPEVQAALGTPIEAGVMLQSNFTSNNTNGVVTESVDLTIPLKGPKGKASLHFSGNKAGGQWKVSDSTVTVEGSGQKIPLGPKKLESAIEQ